MAARVRLRDGGGTLRTMTQIRMRDAGNALRTITRIRMRDAGNVLRVVYDTTGASSFAATASPASVRGFGRASATTAATTVTPTGGTAPYNHSWSLLDETNSTNPAIGSPTAATTAFTQTNLAGSGIDTADFRDTVTDSATPANITTVDVRATFVDTSTL